ncbi:MAG TPA: MauE/DoxX family redox-associated membrane protein [Holophagaceae bacterium]|nr:MauE/DoxX family redox-associated membrane protein [Holophagaceae bacterium]
MSLGRLLKLDRLPAWVPVAARLLLGTLFLIAALPKLTDPPGFAKAVWNYQLVPGRLLAPMALTLPWLELLCGLALLAGVWVRPAATWLAILLLSFMGALGLNLVRHHPVDCGCFATSSAHKTEAERLRDMKLDLARDVGILLLAGLVLASGGKTRREP